MHATCLQLTIEGPWPYKSHEELVAFIMAFTMIFIHPTWIHVMFIMIYTLHIFIPQTMTNILKNDTIIYIKVDISYFGFFLAL
jgi:hypothetical protein